MSKEFVLIDPAKLGDRDPKYGQAYWSDVEGGDQPVMFNLMSSEDLGIMSKVSSDEVVLATSKKGNDYLRLKKVKVLSTGTLNTVEPSEDTKPAGLQPDLRMIYAVVRDNNRLLKQLAGEEVKAAKDTFDNVADMEKDEEINLDDIPF